MPILLAERCTPCAYVLYFTSCFQQRKGYTGFLAHIGCHAVPCCADGQLQTSCTASKTARAWLSDGRDSCLCGFAAFADHFCETTPRKTCLADSNGPNPDKVSKQFFYGGLAHKGVGLRSISAPVHSCCLGACLRGLLSIVWFSNVV